MLQTETRRLRRRTKCAQRELTQRRKRQKQARHQWIDGTAREGFHKRLDRRKVCCDHDLLPALVSTSDSCWAVLYIWCEMCFDSYFPYIYLSLICAPNHYLSPQASGNHGQGGTADATKYTRANGSEVWMVLPQHLILLCMLLTSIDI